MLIQNIKGLVQCRTNHPHAPLKGRELQNLPTMEDAFLLLENDRIKDFGSMKDCPEYVGEIMDATNQFVLPSWVDSHTHLVFAAPREEEFVMRLKGKSYQEITAAGGGILNSAKKLRETSEEVLLEAAKKRLDEVIHMGTGAIEIKSGYGLTVEGELKMLRVIQQLKAKSPIPIKATFLGAHAFPAEFANNHQGYIDLIVNEMIPNISNEGLADYIDAFCEKVAFSVEETRQVLEAGNKHGLKAKVHTNQFNSMGGIDVCIAQNALSVDHLEVVNEAEIQALKNSNLIATLLPSAPFFLSDPYQPARDLIDADIPVALASDFNPGSSPSGNMNFVVALSCIKLGMTPEEAINAASLNGAFALELEQDFGSITQGKKANLLLTKKIPSVGHIPYAFGSDPIDKVILNGKLYENAI